MKIIKKVFACLLSVLFILSLVSINTQNVKAAVEHCTIEFTQGSSDGFTIKCPEGELTVDTSTWFQLGFSTDNSDYYVNFIPTISYSDGNIVLFAADGWSQYSGSYVPADSYKLRLHVNGDPYGKELNNGAVINYPGFNQQYPRSVSISLNQNNDLVVSCDRAVDGKDACSAYLKKLYDTQNYGTYNNGRTNSNIFGNKIAGNPPLMVPVQSPVPDINSEQYYLFEFVGDNLVVTNRKLGLYTTADTATYTNVKLHVVGYNDYYLSGDLKIEILKLKLDVDESLAVGVTWDSDQNNFVIRSSSQEYLSSLRDCTIKQLSSEKSFTFSVNPTVNQDEKGYYVILNSYVQLSRLDSGEIDVNIKLKSNSYNDYAIDTKFTNPYQMVESLKITPVASGFRIKSSNTAFIDMINSKDERFMLNISSNIGRPTDNYRITLDKFEVSKINDNEIIILASQEELEALENSGAEPTEEKIVLDKEDGYVFQIYHPFFDANSSNIRYNLKSILLGSKISQLNNQSSNNSQPINANDLKYLEDLLIQLQNIKVVNNLNNSGSAVTNVNGILAGTICNNYEEGNGDSYLNQTDIRVTVDTTIKDISEDNAAKIAEEVDGEAVGTAFDVNVSKVYKDGSSEAKENVSELAYEAIIEFKITEDIELADDEELVVVREHTNDDGSKAYDTLDVTVDENGVASVASDKFSKFVLAKVKKRVNTPSGNPVTNNSTNTYDDGGPFTTDVCGSIYDRWGNKVYSAPACVLSDGYVVPNTGVK